MKFTQVNPNAFEQIQLNAGILLRSFDPSTATLDPTDIIGATSGGVTFSAEPTFTDFGEDIDNVPNNTKELKKLDSIEAKMTGSFVTASTSMAALLATAADVDGEKVTPRADILETDFTELWWVGDYSDKNGDEDGGFIAIRMMNSLSTGGFQITSEDKGKGKFEFEFTGHYSMENIKQVPYELYIRQGGQPAPGPVAQPTLSSLAIGSLTLTPSFSADVTEYSATTENATNTVTAVPTSQDAVVTITVNDQEIESGTAATWDEGENTVAVSVTVASGSRTYTVTVTKGEL